MYRNLDITQDGRQLPEALDVEEDEIEESIKEEILEASGQHNKEGEKREQAGDRDGNATAANPFNNKTNSNMKSNATPNTILSNKQKLNRGVSRDSEYNFNNGTMLNFGLAGQSTRSTFMKTPLMFGQNAHAKLRDINNQFSGPGSGGPAQNSQYSNNNIFSPQSGYGNRNIGIGNFPQNQYQGKGSMSPISGGAISLQAAKIPPSYIGSN